MPDVTAFSVPSLWVENFCQNTSCKLMYSLKSCCSYLCSSTAALSFKAVYPASRYSESP